MLSGRQFLSQVYAQMWKDEVLDRAAALSFSFPFFLFAALLILTTLFGLLSVLALSSIVLPIGVEVGDSVPDCGRKAI